MKPVGKKHIKLRIVLIGFIFSIFLSVIGARAFYLQVFCSSWLSEKAANQYEKSLIFQGKRGTIYDANHREMALTIDVASIVAYPPNIEDPEVTSRALGNTLKIDINSLKRKLTSDRSFVWIKRKVTPKQLQQVKVLDLKGIDFISEHERFYPNKTLAAQVLGFSGIDGHGLEGIEYYYDSYLKGSACKSTVLKDAFKRGFDTEKNVMSDCSGNNLILTIDHNIQYLTERALEEATVKFNAKSGIAIVMSPKTGAMLAVAHYPFFNPNAFRNFDQDLWRNRSITDLFEPGSTMKIFSACAAIESGKCSPNTIFFCENGKYKIGKNVVSDTHSHGWLSLQQIIKFSSNIGTIKVSETVGPEYLYKTFRNFGFGEKMGIDCPGETSGGLSHYNRWSKIDAGTISFGQGVAVSALQLITAASAIANDGVLMAPYIVQAITDQNGRLIKSSGPRMVRRVVSRETARTVKKMMSSVVTKGGTGVNAALKGYSVCGKTGTAQKIDEKGTYSDEKYIASFLGFIPAEDPEIVVLIVIDEPIEKHFGSIVAAPAFKKIAHETVNYMNIPLTANKPFKRLVDARTGPGGKNGVFKGINGKIRTVSGTGARD
ncbi:MAG: penicillin-binding protein 2 [Deltaproteobacteria bacterium]|nr:penicillin-binding protein 2 [Deltaproteobacteria bacterium]